MTMYQMRYEDVMEESALSGRERESMLFDRCVRLLQAAQKAGPGTQETLDAVLFTRKLWIILIEDLGQAENALAREVKASLISIGFFIIREIEQLETGEKVNFEMLIEISGTLRDSLAVQKAGG